jgi:hypothetical protein
LGHAARAVRGALLAVGLACTAWWAVTALRAPSRHAPFTQEVSAAGGSARAVASFRPAPDASAAGPLRIELVHISPSRSAGRHDRLRITRGEHKTTRELIVGAEIDIAGKSYRVDDIRTWQGLLPVPDGAVMASVSVLSQGDLPFEDILLRAGQRIEIDDRLSLELRACPSAGQSAAASGSAGAGDVPARWGIADGAGVVWFDSFAPGSGATLQDGSVVLLESFDANGPTLIVRKRTAGGEESLRVDGPSSTPPLLLEVGQSTAETVVLCATEDGRVSIAGAGAGADPVELTESQAWTPPGRREDSPFFEAVLESPAQRVRVRQGEAVRVGDDLLRYVREPGNASATIHLRVSGGGGDPSDALLEPGARFGFVWSGGRWSVAHADVSPGDGITIRRAGAARGWLAVGVIAIAAALLPGLVRSAARN